MKDQKNKSQEQNGFWEDTKENINEGAKIVGDEAKEISEKVASYSEVVFGKIVDYTEELLSSGADLTKEAVNKAQEYAETFRDRREIKKLNDEKKQLASQLGMSFYLEVKNNDNKVPPTILRRKAFRSVIKNLEELDKQILDISEKS